jgi:two-component system phosphate regulon sensor histidine kinase PhoR
VKIALFYSIKLPMNYSIRTYIFISFFCFFILASVQFILVQNSYELTKDRFYLAEKTAIKESYSRFVKVEKIFPGCSAILDSFLSHNSDSLNNLYQSRSALFQTYKHIVADSIFDELRLHQPVQRFIEKFMKEKNLKEPLQYALLVTSLSTKLAGENSVALYDKSEINSLTTTQDGDKSGMCIAGDLKKIDAQNRVNDFSIKGSQKFAYQIHFSLHIEPPDISNAVLKEMILIFSLSVASILIVVILFFVTFKNWVIQKKFSELKSDFINNITHELNTPLAAIIVANKNLQNDRILEKKENIRPLTDVIQRQSDRLKILIGEVLDIASPGKIRLEKKTYSINRLVDQILLDYRLKIVGTETDVQFNQETNEDLRSLDKFRFTTMLVNLINNGIKYNINELKQVVITTKKDNNGTLQLLIKDNGIGIETENLKYIFAKFYRVPHCVLPDAKGLGLGLFYVKQIVDGHGWNVAVKSTPGKGTLFIITMPNDNSKYD